MKSLNGCRVRRSGHPVQFACIRRRRHRRDPVPQSPDPTSLRQIDDRWQRLKGRTFGNNNTAADGLGPGARAVAFISVTDE